MVAAPRNNSQEIQYELDVEAGSPPDVILDAASRYSADLIVIGTHGYRGFRKFMLGSTTQRVLRRAPIPILAVPCAAPRSGASTNASKLTPITTVLAASDFSEPSDSAVCWAADLAHEYAAKLLVAHAVPPLIIPVEWSADVGGLNDERVHAARKQLDAQLASYGADAQIERVVMLGLPVESIAAIVEAHQVNLVVMGLTGTERTLAPRPGSTAYGVLSSAHVPVLVVTPAAAT